MKKHSITILEIGILTGDQIAQNGLLFFDGNHFSIELEDDILFYDFPDTATRFVAILEFDEPNYECFELTLNPNEHFDEFEIIQDQEYFEARSCLLALDLKNNLVEKCESNKKVKI